MKKNLPNSLQKTGFFLAVCLAVSACGTKGPLYIPEQRYPQKAVPQTKAPQDESKINAPEANTGAASSTAN